MACSKAAAFLCGLLLAGAQAVQAAEISVFASNAVKTALEDLVPQFEQLTGHKVKTSFAPAAELKARIEKGEACDVAILTTALIEDLAKQNRIAAVPAQADIARAGIGVAIRKGEPKPDLGSAATFKQALLSAKSVAYVSAGASGATMRRIFDSFGIAAEMKPKTKLLSGVSAADAVALGDADLGFTQISEILAVPGVELAGPLPPEVQVYTVFRAGVVVPTSKPAAPSGEFIRFLKTPEAAQVIKARGMEPG